MQPGHGGQQLDERIRVLRSQLYLQKHRDREYHHLRASVTRELMDLHPVLESDMYAVRVTTYVLSEAWRRRRQAYPTDENDPATDDISAFISSFTGPVVNPKAMAEGFEWLKRRHGPWQQVPRRDEPPRPRKYGEPERTTWRKQCRRSKRIYCTGR